MPDFISAKLARQQRKQMSYLKSASFLEIFSKEKNNKTDGINNEIPVSDDTKDIVWMKTLTEIRYMFSIITTLTEIR